jgi:hypothetical protein
LRELNNAALPKETRPSTWARLCEAPPCTQIRLVLTQPIQNHYLSKHREFERERRLSLHSLARAQDSVSSSVEMAVSWGRSHRDLSNITAIVIDEREWQLGHHYLTLVYQIDAHCKGQFSSGIVEGFNKKAKLRENHMVLEPITRQKSLYIIH